jgi:hypothetical protein
VQVQGYGPQRDHYTAAVVVVNVPVVLDQCVSSFNCVFSPGHSVARNSPSCLPPINPVLACDHRAIVPRMALVFQSLPSLRETLNKSGPALLVDLNLIRETTSHDFSA